MEKMSLSLLELTENLTGSGILRHSVKAINTVQTTITSRQSFTINGEGECSTIAASLSGSVA